MSNLPTILFVAIFALGSMQLNTATKFREVQADADAVQNTITQLAQAQHRRVTDLTTVNFGTYATSPAQLQAEGYLAHWSGSADYSFDFTGTSGFVIQYVAATVGDAQRAAARMGETASVTGSTVRFSFASPEGLSLLDVFVKKAGDEMYGSLEMLDNLDGTPTDLIMNNNSIISKGYVEVRNDGEGNTATINTNNANADVLTVQTFRVIN